jgi:hypothetical protein
MDRPNNTGIIFLNYSVSKGPLQTLSKKSMDLKKSRKQSRPTMNRMMANMGQSFRGSILPSKTPSTGEKGPVAI